MTDDPPQNSCGFDYFGRRDQMARKSLAKMIMRLFALWQIPEEEQCLLLGFLAEESSILSRYRGGEPFPDNAELLQRVSHLLSIHRSLRTIFPHQRDLAYRWISQPNRHFGGQRPLDLMFENVEGLLSIRQYLEFELSR